MSYENNGAMTWEEFVESKFDGRDYQFPDFDGKFMATIACKRWNQKGNMLVYLDGDDGRKIITSARPKDGFCGLDEMPVGTKICAVFGESNLGNFFLRTAEEI